MPSVNLRLSDEQHASLTAAAARGGRSLQRQIIWMLFSGETPERPLAISQPIDQAAETVVPHLGGKRFRGPDLKPSSEKKPKRGR